MSVLFTFLATLMLTTTTLSSQTAQTVNRGPDLCLGVCASGSWSNYTLNTTISSTIRTGDNRPQDSTDTCHVTIYYRKRVCSTEVSLDAKVSIIIDGVCSDCPKQTNDLLGRIIYRALVIDDPMNLRQAGKTANDISFSTRRCWALVYCSGTFCSQPCDCDTTDEESGGLRDICEACCVTNATIYVDGQCNISTNISGLGYHYNNDESCSIAVPPSQCLNQQSGAVIVPCSQMCPLYVEEYYRY